MTDVSSSTALIVLIIEDDCYVINLGINKAFLGYNEGKEFYKLTTDHILTSKSEVLRSTINKE